MVVIDATARLLDEAVGNEASIESESFTTGLLEYPQYTRPRDFMEMSVPDVLISGDHQKIADWKRKEALRRTYQRRPDLLVNRALTSEEEEWLEEFRQEEQSKGE